MYDVNANFIVGSHALHVLPVQAQQSRYVYHNRYLHQCWQ